MIIPVFIRGVVLAALVAGAIAGPAHAQSSSAELGEAIAADLGRPLTPPESWALQQYVRDHLGKVREVREAYIRALAEATGLGSEDVAAVLPPLGRGSLSADRDLRPVLAQGLGRDLTSAEEAAVAAAEEQRAAALAPHRRALADRLETLTGLDPARLLTDLAGLGL